MSRFGQLFLWVCSFEQVIFFLVCQFPQVFLSFFSFFWGGGGGGQFINVDLMVLLLYKVQ